MFIDMIIIFILLVAIGVYWFVLRGEDPTPTPTPYPHTDVEESNTQTPDDEDECGEWSDWSLCCGSTIPPGATVRRNGCTYDMRHLNGRTVLTPDDPCTDTCPPCDLHTDDPGGFPEWDSVGWMNEWNPHSGTVPMVLKTQTWNKHNFITGTNPNICVSKARIMDGSVGDPNIEYTVNSQGTMVRKSTSSEEAVRKYSPLPCPLYVDKPCYVMDTRNPYIQNPCRVPFTYCQRNKSNDIDNPLLRCTPVDGSWDMATCEPDPNSYIWE